MDFQPIVFCAHRPSPFMNHHRYLIYISSVAIAFISLSLQAITVDLSLESSDEFCQELNVIIEEYQTEYNFLHPMIATFSGDMRYNSSLGEQMSAGYFKNRGLLESRSVSKLNALPINCKSNPFYKSFLFSREVDLKFFKSDLSLKLAMMPITYGNSIPFQLLNLSSKHSSQPFNTEEDYYNWLERLLGFESWVDAAITKMEEGKNRNILQSESDIEEIISVLDNNGYFYEEIFLTPIKKFPYKFSERQRKIISNNYIQVIQNKVLPSYGKLLGYLKMEYFPYARKNQSIASLPFGKDLYLFFLESYSSYDLDPRELFSHQIKQISEKKNEMLRITKRMRGDRSLKDFTSDLYSDSQLKYRSTEEMKQDFFVSSQKIKTLISPYFYPRSLPDFGINILNISASSTQPPIYYEPMERGGKEIGNIFLSPVIMKTHRKFMRDAILFHEGYPGHHLQLTLEAQSQVPYHFDRMEHKVSFIEGWAFYVESLSKELEGQLGMYQYLGFHYVSLLRSCRAAVDIGVNYNKWSLERAASFMELECALPKSMVDLELNWILHRPAYAQTYILGERMIRELKERARASLGTKFDIRSFHEIVLSLGALPLSIMESELEKRMQAKRIGQSKLRD